MTVALVGVLGAVLGAWVGAALNHWFQRRNADRAERQAKLERLRQDRMAVYSEYAGAIIELRRAQLDKWFNPEDEQKRADARRTRSGAFHHYYRVVLIADNDTIVQHAKAALDAAASLDEVDPKDREGLGRNADHLRDVLVQEFILAGEDQVRV